MVNQSLKHCCKIYRFANILLCPDKYELHYYVSDSDTSEILRQRFKFFDTFEEAYSFACYHYKINSFDINIIDCLSNDLPF